MNFKVVSQLDLQKQKEGLQHCAEMTLQKPATRHRLNFTVNTVQNCELGLTCERTLLCLVHTTSNTYQDE